MTEILDPNISVSHRPAALLTDASRGIGGTIAPQPARSGCDLFLLARKEQEELEDYVTLCRATGAHVVTRLADVNNSTVYTEVFTDFDRHFFASNLLVANAGISHLGLLQNITPDDWGHMMRTGLSSCFYLSRFAIPRMLHTDSGKLIFLSSVWGSRGASCEAAYSAAEDGVNNFTRAFAKELTPSNIQVDVITPGAINTNMNVYPNAEERRALGDEIPAGRLGIAEEVAVLVCQLATVLVYFTGNILTLLGGWVP